jgi:hypothetical protein
MRAVVAIAEQADDPFRGICLVTLTEIREHLVTLLLHGQTEYFWTDSTTRY